MTLYSEFGEWYATNEWDSDSMKLMVLCKEKTN
jgi:hypothetical protein